MRLRNRALIAVVGIAAVMLRGNADRGAATVTVGTAAQLTSALAAANPGTVIELAANTTFTGNFTAAKSGTSSGRITLRGPRSAVLKASGVELTGSYWTIDGFTVTGGQKGLMALSVKNILVNHLKATGIAHEGIHIQHTNSDNVVQDSEVTDTGREYGATAKASTSAPRKATGRVARPTGATGTRR
jgi:hypothetical protein